MNRQKVNDITGLAAPVRSRHLIRRKVDGVQNVAEGVIAHGREETEIAVSNPLNLGLLAAMCNLDRINSWRPPQPFDLIAVLAQCAFIFLCSLRYAFFQIMKNINVSGVARGIAIEWRASGYIALGIAVRRQQPKNLRLDFRQRHG